jgi:hypothetical protein
MASRGVPALAGAAALALLLPTVPGAAAVAADATSTARAAAECPAPFPVDELAVGAPVSGLTVERGTTPDAFTGEVLGVIDDGIAPGIDMVVVDLDSPALQRAGGIWQGMSGSPVYAADGRLVGAVSYGLSYGPSKIAGVTPAADMFAVLDRPGTTSAKRAAALQPARTVSLPGALRQRVAASDARNATAVRADATLQQLRVPVAVSGVSARRLNAASTRLQKQLPGARFYAAGSVAPTATAAPADIFAGSNVAAVLSSGDVTAAGVGTTTAVCGDRAVAFGHPMTFEGTTTMGAHTASAVFVQPDSLGSPFKVANIGGAVGTVDQDRLAAIRATVGSAPTGVPVTSTISGGAAGRTGRTVVNVPTYLSSIAVDHLVANLDRVADRYGPGSATLKWTVSGRRASGAPFQVSYSDRYADLQDYSFGAAIDVFDPISELIDNPFEDTRITGVDFQGSVSDRYEQYTVGTVWLRGANGKLTALSNTRPVTATAGTRLNLRVALVPYRGIGATRTVDVSVVVPAGAAGASGQLVVAGGLDMGMMSGDPGTDSGGDDSGTGSFPGDTEPKNFDQLVSAIRATPPNASVNALLSVDVEDGDSMSTRTTRARVGTDQVVAGTKLLPVQIAAPRSSRIGVVDGRTWSLRSSLSTGKPTQRFGFGNSTDVQVMGDWDGNGTKTPAVFRNGRWYVRMNWTSPWVSFAFGSRGDLPVVGDWDGDGRDGIGVYRKGRWLLRNTASAGPAQLNFVYGDGNRRPVVGDWDGDGIDTIGLFRDGTWWFRNSNSAGLTARSIRYGAKGDVPVVGEWDLDGRDEIGVYRKGRWLLRNTLTAGGANRSFTFGGARSRPVVWS